MTRGPWLRVSWLHDSGVLPYLSVSVSVSERVNERARSRPKELAHGQTLGAEESSEPSKPSRRSETLHIHTRPAATLSFFPSSNVYCIYVYCIYYQETSHPNEHYHFAHMMVWLCFYQVLILHCYPKLSSQSNYRVVSFPYPHQIAIVRHQIAI